MNDLVRPEPPAASPPPGAEGLAPAAGEPAIVVANLQMGWSDDAILLDDASFEVRRGEIFAILGGSGCGKSTLLRYLVGLDRPRSGKVDIAGVGTPQLEVGRPAFGVMFQGGALFGSMTVGENVALPLEEWTELPHDAIAAMARAKLRLVGLEDAENKLPSELSGGMKKRAAIARAMALEPWLLFLDEPSAGLDPVSSAELDEPSAGLDPVTSAELDELIRTLQRVIGLTVVLVTHELESIFAIVDRCIMLDKETRSILAEGAPRALAESDDPRVRAFFNRTARSAR